MNRREVVSATVTRFLASSFRQHASNSTKNVGSSRGGSNKVLLRRVRDGELVGWKKPLTKEHPPD
jgi:hypothetical protein